MGPLAEAAIPSAVAHPDLGRAENGHHVPRDPGAQAAAGTGGRSTAPVVRNLRLADWAFRSHWASVLWLVVRLWLGYQWINAGYQKIWGAERSAFWFGSGTGVKGFATAGVLGSSTGKGGASYGWWAGFLHNFVIPNASWIAKFIALGELAIGVGLVLGLFTGLFALAGLSLNVIYMFSGSAGVNPMYALLSVLLVLAWRNAGWIGLDRLVPRGLWTQLHGTKTARRVPSPVPLIEPAP